MQTLGILSGATVGRQMLEAFVWNRETVNWKMKRIEESYKKISINPGRIDKTLPEKKDLYNEVLTFQHLISKSSSWKTESIPSS